VLAPDELVTAVRIPKFSADARWGYYKACRKVGEFAHASGAILHDPARGVSRAVIGAIEARPIVFADTRELYGGTGDNLAKKFVPDVALRAMQAAGVKDPIEQKLHLVALRRAVEQACAR
jgi:carbon-monoxide dehydrogenase medium subunit